MIFLGADHRGYYLKEKIKDWLSVWQKNFTDLGNDHYDKDDDFTDFAYQVAKKVVESKALGILVCGFGAGMNIAANKVKGIRSIQAFSEKGARQGRIHDNANILTLAADELAEQKAKKIVKTFLESEFSPQSRFVRRLKKIEKIENKLLNC